MKGRQTLVYLVVLLVIGGLFYYFEVVKKEEKETTEKASKQVFSIDPAQVNSVEIVSKEAGTLVLKKEGETWRIVQPVRADVDEGMMEEFLGALDDLPFEQKVAEAAQNLKPYGLDEPEMLVRFTVDGCSMELLFGKPDPVGTGRYARTGEKPNVLLIEETNVASLWKGLDDFRKRQLFAFNPEDVTGLSVTWKDGSSAAVERKDDRWIAPAQPDMPVKGDKVADLIEQIHWLQAVEFLENEPKNLEVHGLEPPLVTVDFRLANGGTAQLRLGEEKEDQNQAPAFSSGLSAVVLVDATFLADLPKNVQALLDRSLVRLNPEEVTRLRWKLGDRQGEFVQIDAQTWGLKGEGTAPKPVAAPWRVRSILWTLNNSEYIEKPGPQAPFPDEPHGRLVIGAGDKELAALAWEKTPPGDAASVALRLEREGNTEAFKVESSLVLELEENLQGMLQPAHK